MVKRFGEHVVTVVVHSRGLESHVNRLIQLHPSDVGVGAGGGDSSASLCTLRAGQTGPTAFEVSDGAELLGDADADGD